MRACWQHAVSIGQPAKACLAISETLGIAADPEDRASLLDDLIGALQAAGDIRGVVTAVRDRRSLSSRVHDTPERAAQLASDEDEAIWVRNSGPEVAVTTLRTHLESPLLNAHRRFKVARLLMMAAEGNLDDGLAAYTIEICSRIAPESLPSKLLQLHVSLIYHTIFGDPDIALRIADEIQEDTRKVERSWQTLMLERNCEFARQLVGTSPSDYACFERGFAQAIDASLTPVALWFAGSLMSVLVDDGDVSTAHEWMKTAERLEPSIHDEDWPIDYLGAQIDLALLLGNHKKAKRYYEVTLKCARYQSARLRNDQLIYGLRIRQFSGERWAPKEHLDELLSFHQIARHRTRHDDHMEVLWQALRADGQADRATALLSDYIQLYRREKRPCRYLLRLRTQCDPAWQRYTACGSAPMPL